MAGCLIVSAPKDGSSLLLYDPSFGRSGTPRWVTGLWEGDRWMTDTEYFMEREEINPTHWHPLPDTPSNSDAVGRSDGPEGRALPDA